MLDAIALFPEYYLTETLTSEIASARPNSVVLVWSYSHDRYEYAHVPPGIRFRKSPFLNVFSGAYSRIPYLLYPIRLLVHIPVVFLYYLWMGLKFRVNTVFVAEQWHALILAPLRVCRIFRRLVYYQGDWLPGSNPSAGTGIWSRLNREVCFPVVDWLACKLSDLTVNQIDQIRDARTRHWGRKIPKEEITFVPALRLDCKDPSGRLKGSKILFQGVSRPDSGLKLVLEALPVAMKHLGPEAAEMALKIVGPENETVKNVARFASESGLDRYFDYAGYIDRTEFEEAFADCFCGVNMITASDSYSTMAVPGKVMYYIQFLLPSLVSPYNGPIVDTIRENKLGLVVSPDTESVVSALVELYRNRHSYVQNCQAFLATQSSTNIVQILWPETTKK